MNLYDVNLIELYRKWKENLGYFRGFFRSTPFVSLQTYDNFKLYPYNNSVDNEILNIVLDKISEKAFCIVDMPFSKIINLALKINNEFNIKPILNLNIMFNEYGIIGNKHDISDFINVSMRLNNIKPRNYVMLFDYNRYKDEVEEDIINKLNNQYGIGEDDIPDIDMIKSLGYNKLTIISKSIKEDLEEVIEYIKDHIYIEIIKVD